MCFQCQLCVCRQYHREMMQISKNLLGLFRHISGRRTRTGDLWESKQDNVDMCRQKKGQLKKKSSVIRGRQWEQKHKCTGSGTHVDCMLMWQAQALLCLSLLRTCVARCYLTQYKTASGLSGCRIRRTLSQERRINKWDEWCKLACKLS